MARVSVRRKLLAVDVSPGGREPVTRTDSLAGEEPLEIRSGDQPITVTMRTPGHDVELIHGFLLGEGVITASADVISARYCAGSVVDDETGTPRNTYNVMELALTPGAALRLGGAIRNFGTTSSCGVCGQASIDDVEAKLPGPVGGDLTVPATVIAGLPDRLREEQRVFERTGGIHASGWYDVAHDHLLVREDVGRHNAADKVIGAALLAGDVPATGAVLVLSGRVSFELVQKAAMARIAVVVAVSAPSSLAVALADRLGITVVGFTRGGRFNVYTHPHRIDTKGPR